MAGAAPAIAGICIIGTRRTGSNHLMNVVSNFRDLEATGELFSRHRIIGIHRLLPQLRRATGMPIPDADDKALHAHARENPGAFLDALELAVRHKRKRAYCFKVFEDQLSREAIETQVLSRPGMRSALLVRRALDTYISLAKATLLDEWMTRDTTATPVVLDAGSFASWLEGERAWYGHWLARAKARGETPLIMTYEEDIDRPNRVVLRRFAAMARGLGIPLAPPLLVRNRGLARQDRNRDLAARVANWDEFVADLDRLGLREAARGYPL